MERRGEDEREGRSVLRSPPRDRSVQLGLISGVHPLSSPLPSGDEVVAPDGVTNPAADSRAGLQIGEERVRRRLKSGHPNQFKASPLILPRHTLNMAHVLM